MAQFKYFETSVTNQNLIQKQIRRGMNLGNACCHSVSNLTSSDLLSKNAIIGIHKTIIYPWLYMGIKFDL
jgi:hypothetical protein